ncbi:DUF4350 domain-containing protein [Thiorhodococcus minor]|uniref:DUF4350 domain-containing protein n=1 Tax=Thiorhodococcus minor TaxID=57489 RepID=A0A6M0JVE4_9GAMM|nr:DUF4350 domain-containing protein [Thiorhodococcus minor]NEV60573.1 DUF4350 domain-containing protein [Thiorhodococcus minor]
MDERRALSLVVGGLVLIAVTAMVSWFFANFERRTERIPVGYSSEARRNALLAAERFLKALELPAESVTGRDRLWHLPAATDTLVVLGVGPMSTERQARLMAWLKQGGHLIVEAMETWEEDTPPAGLLTDLGFRLRFDAGEGADDDDGTRIATLDLADAGRPVKVAFQSGYALEGRDGDEILAAAAGRPRILQRRIGEGRLTVLSDSGFLTNTSIGEHDHAYFAAQLLAPEKGGRIWLLYDSDMPWLGALLWGIAPYALTSVAVLAVVWLWSLGRRLGPLVTAPDRRRRDLIEHLDASGDFLWRHNGTTALVDSSRKRILGDWLRHHPDLAQHGSQAQAEALAAFTGESVERIYRSLFAQPDDARGFTEQAMLLQQLRQGPRRGKLSAQP